MHYQYTPYYQYINFWVFKKITDSDIIGFVSEFETYVLLKEKPVTLYFVMNGSGNVELKSKPEQLHSIDSSR